jgi:hypothetical protein
MICGSTTPPPAPAPVAAAASDYHGGSIADAAGASAHGAGSATPTAAPPVVLTAVDRHQFGARRTATNITGGAFTNALGVIVWQAIHPAAGAEGVVDAGWTPDAYAKALAGLRFDHIMSQLRDVLLRLGAYASQVPQLEASRVLKESDSLTFFRLDDFANSSSTAGAAELSPLLHPLPGSTTA